MGTLSVDRDRGLVELHRAGFDGAFAELYREHFGRVVNLCTRLLGGDRHRAEEIAQEAFCRALVHFDALDDDRRFYGWVAGIARRLVADFYRERARFDRMATRWVAAERVWGHSGQSPERAVLEQLADEQLVEAMDRLSPRQREVLRMRDTHGMSSEDIGRHLGIGADSVRPLLQRARRALRRECRLITSSERLSGLLPVSLLAGTRRWRARWLRWAGTTPELATLGLPAVQLAAMGFGALFIGQALAGGPPATATQATAVTVATDPAPGPSFLADGSSGRDTAVTPTELVEVSPAADGRPNVRVGPVPGFRDGVASMHWGRDGAEDRRRARERMPIYQPIGPSFIAVDPNQMEHDIRQALTPQ